MTFQIPELSNPINNPILHLTHSEENKTETIKVTADVTVPTLTLLGKETVSLELGSTYTDAAATALDNIDGNLTSAIVINGTVDTNAVGVYTLTYDVKDAAGNAATQVTRTVTVLALPSLLTHDTPLSKTSCKSFIRKSGHDTNRNGTLEESEVTTTINPYYTQGTPITLDKLKEMIASDEDVTGINTCMITDMHGLFYKNTTFNQDISK